MTTADLLDRSAASAPFREALAHEVRAFDAEAGKSPPSVLNAAELKLQRLDGDHGRRRRSDAAAGDRSKEAQREPTHPAIIASRSWSAVPFTRSR